MAAALLTGEEGVGGDEEDDESEPEADRKSDAKLKAAARTHTRRRSYARLQCDRFRQSAGYRYFSAPLSLLRLQAYSSTTFGAVRSLWITVSPLRIFE